MFINIGSNLEQTVKLLVVILFLLESCIPSLVVNSAVCILSFPWLVISTIYKFINGPFFVLYKLLKQVA
jgi:hypothetical protein